ncbi:MAG: hypothetical protein ACKOXK_05780 [Chakrabartia sp.]
MTSIDTGRLMQMRSSILNQNAALQRATGARPAAEPLVPAAATEPKADSFGATMVDALQAVNAQQAKAAGLGPVEHGRARRV